MSSLRYPSIVAGLFVLIVPVIQLTGRTSRVRDPYHLFSKSGCLTYFRGSFHVKRKALISN